MVFVERAEKHKENNKLGITLGNHEVINLMKKTFKTF